MSQAGTRGGCSGKILGWREGKGSRVCVCVCDVLSTYVFCLLRGRSGCSRSK